MAHWSPAWQWTLLALVTCSAGVVRGLAGFGGPLILVPVFSFFYPPPSAIASVMLIDFSANLKLLPDALRQSRAAIVLPIIGGALLTLPLAGWLLHSVPVAWLRDVVYLVVGTMSLLILSGWRYRGSQTTGTLLAVGAANGMVVGTTAIGVALYPFLIGGLQSAVQSRAHFIVWAFFCTSSAFVVVWLNGSVGAAEWWRALWLAPAYLGGVFVGNRSYRLVDEAVLRRLVLLVLIAVEIAGVLA